MPATAWIDEVVATLGHERVSTRRADLEAASHDESSLPPSFPEAVAWPLSTEEVAALVTLAVRHEYRHRERRRHEPRRQPDTASRRPRRRLQPHAASARNPRRRPVGARRARRRLRAVEPGAAPAWSVFPAFARWQLGQRDDRRHGRERRQRHLFREVWRHARFGAGGDNRRRRRSRPAPRQRLPQDLIRVPPHRPDRGRRGHARSRHRDLAQACAGSRRRAVRWRCASRASDRRPTRLPG